ncbi:unnamed protein product, partial [Brassica rapa subsp. trilocularis]
VPAAAAASTFGVNSCSFLFTKKTKPKFDAVGESLTQLHLYLSLSISILEPVKTSRALSISCSLHLKLSLHLELPPSQALSPSRALFISGSLSVTSCLHLRLSGSLSVTICLHLGLSLFSEENPSPISSRSSLLRAHLISKLSLLLFSLRSAISD